jgi:hypothetical protein
MYIPPSRLEYDEFLDRLENDNIIQEYLKLKYYLKDNPEIMNICIFGLEN